MKSGMIKAALLAVALLPGAVALAAATATETEKAIVLDNGQIRLTLNKANGQLSEVRAMIGGESRIISDPKSRNALYLDWNGGPENVPDELKAKAPKAGYGGPKPDRMWVVSKGPNPEVAVTAPAGQWNPFRVEYHYRLDATRPLFYAWVRYEHAPGMPAGNIGQTRLVFRGQTGTDLFTNHVVDAKRKGPYSTSPIVATLQDATNLHADGTVHTKYDNSDFTANYDAYGLWGHGVGVWVLWPSVEFCNGGPLRQDLAVHYDNTLLAMFQSGHYGAGAITFAENEQWSKLCGPVVFYVNQKPDVDAARADALKQAAQERGSWPYTWLKNDDYPLKRGVVRGNVRLTDGRSAAGAWAVLSPVEDLDWARSAKGYQFFTRVNADNSFEIPNVRPGQYKLNLSGADEPVDFAKTIDVGPATPTDLGTLDWTPATHGKQLWQLGVFDRGTTEFLGGDDPRNYTRFLDYFKAFPNDVVYTIGKSDPKRDWFYAQWNWYNKTPRWTIKFDAAGPQRGKATLTVGIASREYASGKVAADVADRGLSSGELVVCLNGQIIAKLTGPKTGAAGYRSGSQDSQYVMERVIFDASKLKQGENEITFEHAVSQPFPADHSDLQKLRRPRGSVMYDAIRLEVGP